MKILRIPYYAWMRFLCKAFEEEDAMNGNYTQARAWIQKREQYSPERARR